MNTRLGPVRDGVVLAAVPESVAAARHWFADWLAGHGVALPHFDAELVISELVTNVVRHGAGDVICHSAMVDETLCCVTVIDVGPGRPRLVGQSAHRIGGLGLHIVERLAVDWGVADFPAGKAVWAIVSVVGTAAELT